MVRPTTKRKVEDEHHATYDKRLRTAPSFSSGSRIPALGTQDAPVEIESSPEPEQNTTPPRSTLSVKEWGLPVDLSGGRPYYAIVGHVPGIYTGNWKAIEDAYLRGYQGNKKKKFKTVDEAWDFLEEHRHLVEQALNRDRGRAYLTSIGKAPPAKPQPRRSAGIAQHQSPLPSSSYTQSRSYSNQSATPESEDESLTPQTAFQRPNSSLNGPQPRANNNVAAAPEVTLDPEQHYVVDLIMAGCNVFYTGPAGCGKSAILRVFKKRLEEQRKIIFVTAPTNIAALAIGGQTTYSYAGWHMEIGKEPLNNLKKRVLKGRQKELFCNTDVLVVDEISMVENNFFGRLSEVMKSARNSKEAFGGVQIIVTGDFCQLAPVKPFRYCFTCGAENDPNAPRNPTEYVCGNCRHVYYDVDKWAFRSQAWKECNFVNINLSKIHRQDDPFFRSILNRIRLEGIIQPEHKEILLNHESETEGAIEISTHKALVAKQNKKKIDELPGKAIAYRCKDFFLWKDHHKGDISLKKYLQRGDGGHLHYLSDHRYEAELDLKQNMRVVLLHNLAPGLGLVNGSQGTIIGFERYDPEKLPIKDSPLTGPHARYCEEEIKRFAERNEFRPWPVVRFDNGLTETIYADCSAAERGVSEPFSLLSRTQIPLMAGYSVTIHKAQGMTLDKVKVDLAKSFETEQPYVALSRAKSLHGLTVLSLPAHGFGGRNREVKEFLDSFSRNSVQVL
ncbi:ATP-dependent DNA helicase PIF1 [Pyrenophora tritici-repentis]|uniref:ATP-dependent DNA helicase n=1 Tax=Pyrenophora tritici-repentis TaxID=45151 RepID=A0A2W1FM87_9PLEO|nr:ATP-dependent DNA helicase PIF1 [Pyrenophora tritici-repentis]KAF7444808.1 ATP-dependent DNA helicase PIF1 [Pyrenophora tritici-repentis]KAF7564533.1 ATP-dependent DNA helicase PIF1 [Pyrenophora tritici-repentis]KAG9379045.1 ATP-dependent DNA helicase PIF1 [Pyrenophora tritici-repentis]KAI0585783.1 ATP-dependent DNA helicase PIF1 [Pyrenophora tritici-repentis]